MIENETLACPKMFDGILCWEKTNANSIARQLCPSYVVGFINLKGYATIFCTPNGTWQKKRSDSNKTYTNYESCILADMEETILLVFSIFILFLYLLLGI